MTLSKQQKADIVAEFYNSDYKYFTPFFRTYIQTNPVLRNSFKVLNTRKVKELFGEDFPKTRREQSEKGQSGKRVNFYFKYKPVGTSPVEMTLKGLE